MNKVFLAIVLALLVAGTYFQSNDSVIAFSWLQGYCDFSRRCSAAQLQRWDNQSFTIHGLWPSQRTNNRYGNFNINIILSTPNLYSDMRNYWPPNMAGGANIYFLWQHEWNSHGHDYAEILLRLFPNRFPAATRNTELQRAYFVDTVNIYKQYALGAATPRLRRYPQNQVNRSSLAQIFRITNTDQLTISCALNSTGGNGTQVREFKVCIRFGVNITNNTLTHTFIRCPSQVNTNCSAGAANFILSNWRVTSQNEVFR